MLDPAPGEHDWKAVDPGIVEDGAGVPWLALGTHRGGPQACGHGGRAGDGDACSGGDVRPGIRRLARDDGWPVTEPAGG